MTTPDRPKYIRVTGPPDALGLTVGKIYRVVKLDGDAPVVHDDDYALWTLAPAGVAGSRFLAAWEPYVYVGEEDPS